MPEPGSHGKISVAHVTTIDLSLRYLLLNQLETIQARGYRVYGLSAPGPKVSELERAGIRFIPIPFVRATSLKPIPDARAFFELVKVFRRERFTIVHTHTAKPDLFATWAARIAGVPVVITTLHGFLAHDGMTPFWRRFYLQLAKIGMAAADSVLSQNDEDLETAAREHICPPDKMKFLGNGIDVVRFDPARFSPETRAQMRAELGIPPDAPVVGFVGRLVRDKGVPELLAAAVKTRTEIPNARFLFVGMIDHAKADAVTPEMAKAYGVAEACIFTGQREDMPELFSVMDVFALPSYREAFPRAPMEASAMGVPCVVTNVRGCRTAVKEGENGLLVPLGDVDALAGALSDLLMDRQKSEVMGVRARQMALERFDERRVFDTVLDEYAFWMEKKGLAGTNVFAETSIERDVRKQAGA
jgi:glycosyltransferase involved in cell wall biosynthesis